MDLGNITKVILLALLIVFVMHWRIIWCYGEYVYSGCLCGSMISLYNFLFSEFLSVANSIFYLFLAILSQYYSLDLQIRKFS